MGLILLVLLALVTQYCLATTSTAEWNRCGRMVEKPSTEKYFSSVIPVYKWLGRMIRGRHQSPPSLQFGLKLSEDCIILIGVFTSLAFTG